MQPAIVIIIVFVGHLPKGVGLDYNLSSPLLPISMLSLPCIFSYTKTFPASLQVILIKSCSVNTCNFGVSIGGDELRVFLLFCLGHSPLQPFSCFENNAYPFKIICFCILHTF